MAVDEVQSSEADGLDCYVNIIEKAVLHEKLIKTKTKGNNNLNDIHRDFVRTVITINLGAINLITQGKAK
jgi:hypothetical protein